MIGARARRQGQRDEPRRREREGDPALSIEPRGELEHRRRRRPQRRTIDERRPRSATDATSTGVGITVEAITPASRDERLHRLGPRGCGRQVRGRLASPRSVGIQVLTIKTTASVGQGADLESTGGDHASTRPRASAAEPGARGRRPHRRQRRGRRDRRSTSSHDHHDRRTSTPGRAPDASRSLDASARSRSRQPPRSTRPEPGRPEGRPARGSRGRGRRAAPAHGRASRSAARSSSTSSTSPRTRTSANGAQVNQVDRRRRRSDDLRDHRDGRPRTSSTSPARSRSRSGARRSASASWSTS